MRHKSFQLHLKQQIKWGGRFWFCAANCYRGLLHNACSKSINACSSPLCFASLLSNRHLWFICLCQLHAEIKPFGLERCINLSEATETRWLAAVCVSYLCSVICKGLTLKLVELVRWRLLSLPEQSALHTAFDVPVAYVCVLFVMNRCQMPVLSL